MASDVVQPIASRRGPRLVGALAAQVAVGALDGGGVLAGQHGTGLHALLDGLALQLIRQGPDDPCDWALDVLQDHLEQLTGAAAGFRDMRDPGH